MNYINNQIYLKSCDDPRDYNRYSLAFGLELDHMQRLQHFMELKKKGQTYSNLFPHYKNLQYDSKGRPFLHMEKIGGETLEDYLCRQRRHNRPYPLLNDRQILHIYDQLHLAVTWLFYGNIIQFDLSPQNIMIDNQFNIHLIDFTDCYYTDLSHLDNIKKGCKKIDYRLNSSSPVSFQLRDTYALLFTRLFFCGKKHYDEYFSFRSDSEKSKITRSFFDREYPRLLNCLFYPDDPLHYETEDSCRHPLTDLEIWCRQLTKLLLKKISG